MTGPVPPPPRTRGRRRLGGLLLVLAVLAAHLLVAGRWAASRLGSGAADRAPEALDVRFVQELAPQAPSDAPPPPRPQPAPVRAAAPPEGASAPRPPASAPEVRVAAASAPAQAPSADEPPPAAQADAAPPSPETEGAAAAPAPASAASAPAFEWPPSTRLVYALSGWFRGELHGTAQVDWLREAGRYQVRLTVRVPGMLERRMLSDGVIGPQGLRPRRYDQETDVTFAGTRRETVRFGGEAVELVNGRSAPWQPGLQDTASQFVQMTWMFLMRPELRQPGTVVPMPLALPRRVGVWLYDVQPEAPLALPFDPALPAIHLKPRPDAQRPHELLAELWLAPTLQFLPVRILIRQDAENHMQLDLASRPLQGAP